MDVISELQLLGKIVIAALLGGLVGLEREFAEKPAGLQTHMLVGAGAALLVMVATKMITSLGPRNDVMIDPLRIIEAIVVGISFLGAGTILKHTREGEKTVEGLTASASILFVSAIGIAVAMNAFILAVGATLLNLFINWALYYLISKTKIAEQKK
jgi:putative Mg2+ transporter-C (MgtC) family protein